MNWFTVCMLILAALILEGLFYWFQLRPAEIKRECSWIEEQAEAIPAVTQADIEQAKIDLASCKERYPASAGRLQTVAEWQASASYQCTALAKLAAETPHSAQSSKSYYREASPTEYRFCLHSHGL